ncbi:protein SEC13-like protein [Camelus ferus]|nr:protein SEC13-like protein [Camelus ferus]
MFVEQLTGPGPRGLVLGKDEMGEMHDAQMDYYGTRLATCSSDRSVKIFDVRNGGQILIADLRGHEGPVWQVAWAHPMYGNILASCSYDRKVIIWKEENGTWEKTHEHTGHDSSVNSVCWAPHDYGLILACGSSDGAISLLTYTGLGQWEVKKINNAHTIGCNAVSWAPAVVPGSLIDQPSGQKPNYIKKFASGGCDNLIKLWKEEEDGQWKEEQKLEAHSDWVRDVAWAPSIGLPTSTIASCSQDGRVFIWTCDDASGNTWSPKLLHKFNDVVWHVSWSITANILAVSGGDNKVYAEGTTLGRQTRNGSRSPTAHRERTSSTETSSAPYTSPRPKKQRPWAPGLKQQSLQPLPFTETHVHALHTCSGTANLYRRLPRRTAIPRPQLRYLQPENSFGAVVETGVKE